MGRSEFLLKPISKILTLFIVCAWNFSNAQTVQFENYYDFGYAERGYCVQQTPDSGYVITGFQGISLFSSKMIILKTDKNGVQEWCKLIGDGSNDVYGYYIINCSDGGYAAVGYLTGAGFVRDVYVVKLNSVGDTLWTRQYGTNYIEEGTCIQQTSDNGFVISFWDENDSSGVMKIDSAGNQEWSKKYSLVGSPFFRNIIKISSGGYLLTGKTETGPPLWGQGIVMRTDTIGDSLWCKYFGGTSGEEFYESDETLDGNFVIGGISGEASMSSLWGTYLLKIDMNGDSIWSNTFPPFNTNSIVSAQTCADGKFIACGTDYDATNNASVYLLKYNQFGDTLWTKKYGGIDDDYGYSVRQTFDGGYIISGMTSNWDPQGAGVYLIKVDSLGSTVFVSEIPLQSISLSVYPNPTNGFSRFQFASNSDFEIFVFDVRGSLLFSKKVFNVNGAINDVIDFSGYENGIYTVNFVSEENLFSAKIIKTN